MKATTWNRIILFLSFAGIFVAGYMTLSSVLKYEIACGMSHGCQIVENSAYSKWAGIPVAVFGLGAYFALAAMAILRSFGPANLRKNSIRAGLAISGIGTLISAFLVYVAVTEIKATCIWCISSAIIMTLSFFAHGFLSQTDEEGSRRDDLVYIVVLAVFALGGSVGFRLADQKSAEVPVLDAKLLPAKIEEMIPPKGAHILGPSDAKVIIIEFGDLICPHCKDSYHVLSQVVQQSNGQVELVFRQFPLVENREHGNALPAAIISELAAEKGKFWDFIDEMYSVEKQDQLTLDDIYEMGEKVGLNIDEIKKRILDTNDPAFKAVDRDLQLGFKIGIRSTPTLVIGIRGQAPQSGGAAPIKDALMKPPFSAYVRGLQ